MKLKLFVCGDVMPGGVLPYQKDCVSPRLAAFLRGFDCRIGTLEAAIGTAEYPYDPVKMAGRCNIVYARDTDLARICELGFDVVSLANNHVMDLGPEGLRNTLQQLDARGILHCGAGMDAREAARPVIWEKEGLRVAIFAYCMHDGPYLGHVVTAGEKTPGARDPGGKKTIRPGGCAAALGTGIPLHARMALRRTGLRFDSFRCGCGTGQSYASHPTCRVAPSQTGLFQYGKLPFSRFLSATTPADLVPRSGCGSGNDSRRGGLSLSGRIPGPIGMAGCFSLWPCGLSGTPFQ